MKDESPFAFAGIWDRWQRDGVSLSMQPEAFNMGRRLGARFSPSKRETSTLDGTLTIGTDLRTMQTTRTQTDDGEQIEIKFVGSTGSLTWDAAQGALSS